MKKHILTSLCALLLVSCSSTHIKLPQVEPAAFDMHRGASVAVETKGREAYGIGAYLIQMVKQGGYYRYVLFEHEIPDYTIVVNADELGHISYSIYTRDGGHRIWQSEDMSTSWGDVASEEPLDKIKARRIYQTFVPHEGTYWAKVKADDKANPTLAKAVEAAKVGNFGGAMKLTEQAIAEHPNDPEALYLKALLIRSESRFTESDAYLNRALELAPNDSRYVRALKKNDEMRSSEANTIQQLQGL